MSKNTGTALLVAGVYALSGYVTTTVMGALGIPKTPMRVILAANLVAFGGVLVVLKYHR